MPSLSPDPTGTLYENRNRTDDHRSEGLYGSEATIAAKASDARSGIKTLQLFIDKNRNNAYEASEAVKTATGSCTSTQCSTAPVTLNHTLLTDSLPADGDYKVKLIATDQATNTIEKTWEVTVDRRGDIYQATQYGADPATGGQLRAKEWVQLGTMIGRREADEMITTLRRVTCPQAGMGSGCLEWRAATTWSQSDPGMTEDFTSRITTEGDPTTDPAARLSPPHRGQLTATGPLSAVTASWQTVPPNHSASFDRYDSSTEAEGASGELVDVKLWVDHATQYPLKVVATNSAGRTVSQSYWSYWRDPLRSVRPL